MSLTLLLQKEVEVIAYSQQYHAQLNAITQIASMMGNPVMTRKLFKTK